MLTLLSETEIKQLRSSLDAINTLLERAQTVNLQTEPRPSRKVVQVSDTPESQPKTHVSRRKGKRGPSVLTAKKVAEIKRQLLAGGKSVAKIAKEFGVHSTTINCIKWGKTWKEVAPAAAKPLEIMEIRK